MPEVLPLMDQGDQLLQVDPESGKAFYQQASVQAPNRFQASLSGGSGIGGSLTPPKGVQATQAAPKQTYKPPSPEELMALAEQMQGQFDFTPGPSEVEPTLERDTNVPYWLRNYAENEGIDKPVKVASRPKEEIIASNQYMTPDEKRRYMR